MYLKVQRDANITVVCHGKLVDAPGESQKDTFYLIQKKYIGEWSLNIIKALCDGLY